MSNGGTPQTRTFAKRTTVEYAVIPSDRVAMIVQANEFVRGMNARRLAPYWNESGEFKDVAELPMTAEESEAYKAVLGYLRKVYSDGYSNIAQVVAKEEQVETDTFSDDGDPSDDPIGDAAELADLPDGGNGGAAGPVSPVDHEYPHDYQNSPSDEFEEEMCEE